MQQVDFKSLGLDSYADEFLNWCLVHRNNLEWLKQMKTLELRSASATMHFSNVGRIELIEKKLNDKR